MDSITMDSMTMDGMTIEREFHPVGHGAFYSERYAYKDEEGKTKHINVVYDCGSKSMIANFETVVDCAFRKGEVIDAVFISHLHEDHINGIPRLIKRYKVKRIYFPLIMEKELDLLKVRMLIDGVEGFSREFIYSPSKAIKNIVGKNKIKLIGVEEGIIAEGKKDLIEPEEKMGYRINEDYDGSIASGSDTFDKRVVFVKKEKGKEKTKELDWMLIPYNFRQRSRVKELEDSLEELGITAAKLTQILNHPEQYTDAVDKLKKAYRKVSGEFNSNSMTLYSGPNNQDIRAGYDCVIGGGMADCEGDINITRNLAKGNDIKHYCNYIGCLYTGDYNAKKKQEFSELVSKYKEVWKNIGILQVPHHGSSYNFNEGLINPGMICIISAGEKMRNKRRGRGDGYQHPDTKVEVVNYIESRGALLYIVTEAHMSRVRVR